MQDLSRVTGDEVVIRGWNGKDFTVSGVAFGDFGLLQGEILRRKRRSIIEAASAARDYLPPADAKAIMQQALDTTAMVQFVSDEELEQFVRTSAGVQTFLWILLNRQFPGEFKESDVGQMFFNGQLNEQSAATLLAKFAEGGDRSGNATGRATPAEVSRPQ